MFAAQHLIRFAAPLLTVLLVCLNGLSAPAWAGNNVATCTPGTLPVMPIAQILEDPTRALSTDEVAALGDQAFINADTPRPPVTFTHSAIWLRFTVSNTTEQMCHRWLTVGDPRLEDIQVHIQQHDHWSTLQAGSHYPLEQWPVLARQPRFHLALNAGESIQVIVRVASHSAMMVNPMLWDDTALLNATSTNQLLDGLTLGILLLLLPVGLIVTALTRTRLMLLISLALLFYLALVGVVNGYLLYWPALMPWSRQLVACLSTGAFVLFFSYTFCLLRVRLLDTWLRTVFIAYIVCGGLILLWGVAGDFVWSRQLFSAFRNASYLLIPLSFAMAVYRKVKLDWLAMVVCAVLMLQGAIAMSGSIQSDIWLYGEDKLGLSSTLFTAFLLVCTIIQKVASTRQREQAALTEVAYLQEAAHERLENQVELRTQQLREALQARSGLLARISHDLRAPLSNIINYAREIKIQPINDQPQQIERQARQQLEMLDDLLEFSRGELHQIELSLQPGYLFGFLHEIEEEGRHLAVRQHNQLQCILAENLPVLIHADFRQLRRVLINLLNNAAKFTHNGLIQLNVQCTEQHGKAFTLQFEVADNGVGIPLDFRKNLTAPFQRASNSAAIEGFGLGLSIVTELLEQMGATLQVTDNTSSGSVFSFELTLEGASEDEIDQVFLESYAASVEGKERRIVLVDDIELTRVFLGDLLEGYGFNVALAGSAQEALACLAAAPTDILITDQMMPDMDGWALLHQTRQRWPQLPVLLYSASPARPSAGHEQLAFDAALLKPAPSEALLERIEALCLKHSHQLPQYMK